MANHTIDKRESGTAGDTKRVLSPEGKAGLTRSSIGILSSSHIPASARRGEFILAIAATYPETSLAAVLINEYNRITGAEVSVLEPPPERALFEVGLAFEQPPTDEDIQELVRSFEQAVLSEHLYEATATLRRAETAGDTEAITRFSMLCKELSTRIAQLSLQTTVR